MNMASSALSVAKRFRRYLLELNAFSSDSAEKLRVERWTTRVFLVLFLVGAVGIFMYASRITYSTTVVVLRPSHATVDDLLLNYQHLKIRCPCTKSAIPRASFTKIDLAFHKVKANRGIQLDFSRRHRFVQVRSLVTSGSKRHH